MTNIFYKYIRSVVAKIAHLAVKYVNHKRIARNANQIIDSSKIR